MASGAAGDGLLRGMFEGCISGGDMGIKRRPYHKNCGCALHESRGSCKHSSRHSVVSYPIRRSWSEGCLSLMGAAGQSSPCSSSNPAVGGIKRAQTQLVLCKEGNCPVGIFKGTCGAHRHVGPHIYGGKIQNGICILIHTRIQMEFGYRNVLDTGSSTINRASLASLFLIP